ncbi:MFS transporter [Rhizobium pusense]|uniref:MFS transporter n=1 Tax=Agrobacterium pusense TaxID=648995 RepID=UPI001C6F1A93|nr:MFS transporter [Agrobacterium pusense]MBW9080749.1 MFS transporter [Agrobacterium pusense]
MMIETRRLEIPLAACCAVSTATLYYAQPISSEIARELHFESSWAGSIGGAVQIGFVMGLLLLVPLGDIFSPRRLIVGGMLASIAASLALCFSTAASWALPSLMLLGFGAAVGQVVLPIGARFAAPEAKGRAIGAIMAGLLIGILIARPAAMIISNAYGWRVLFLGSAVFTAVAAAFAYKRLPTEAPGFAGTYLGLMISIPAMIRTSRALRTRIMLHGPMFFAFSLFWTAVPAFLTAELRLEAWKAACFFLAGLGGTLAAPLAGRLADQGCRTTPVVLATGGGVIFMGATYLAGTHVLLIAAAAFAFDFSVQTNLVMAQREVFGSASGNGGRINSIFMASFITCGALGSTASLYINQHWGWDAVLLVAAGACAIAFLIALVNSRTVTSEGHPAKLGLQR